MHPEMLTTKEEFQKTIDLFGETAEQICASLLALWEKNKTKKPDREMKEFFESQLPKMQEKLAGFKLAFGMTVLLLEAINVLEKGENDGD